MRKLKHRSALLLLLLGLISGTLVNGGNTDIKFIKEIKLSDETTIDLDMQATVSTESPTYLDQGASSKINVTVRMGRGNLLVKYGGNEYTFKDLVLSPGTTKRLIVAQTGAGELYVKMTITKIVVTLSISDPLGIQRSEIHPLELEFVGEGTKGATITAGKPLFDSSITIFYKVTCLGTVADGSRTDSGDIDSASETFEIEGNQRIKDSISLPGLIQIWMLMLGILAIVITVLLKRKRYQ